MSRRITHLGRRVATSAAVVLTCAVLARAQSAAAPNNAPRVSPPTISAKENQTLGIPASAATRGKLTSPVERQARPKLEGSWFSQTFIPLAGVLVFVVGSGVALRKAARRWGGLRGLVGPGGRAPAGIIEVLGRYPVGRGVTLVLLKLDSRILLLSQSAGGRFGAGAVFTTLAEITEPEQVASILVRTRDAEGDSLTEKFQSMLQRFDRQMTTTVESQPAARGRSDELWDGTRSNIPVIDLTQRDGVRAAAGSLRARLASIRKTPASHGGGR